MLLDDFFAIDDQLFPWGTSLLGVSTHPSGIAWHRADGGWPSLSGPCQSAFGLAVSACYLRAPTFYKPVLHLDYTLAPASPLLNEADTLAHWLGPLTQLLGPPTEASPATPPRPECGSLLFRATWQRAGHHVSLLVHGALEPASAGPTATLTLEWQDLVRAAQPYLASIKYEEDLLTAAYGSPPKLHVVTLQERQPGHGGIPDRDPLGPAALYQQAKRALYYTGVYRTPTRLHAHLNEQQVALWVVMGEQDLAVSTKWTTVLLPGRPGPSPDVELVTTRPAKGVGFMSLYVGELERRSYVTVTHSENWDC